MQYIKTIKLEPIEKKSIDNLLENPKSENMVIPNLPKVLLQHRFKNDMIMAIIIDSAEYPNVLNCL